MFWLLESFKYLFLVLQHTSDITSATPFLALNANKELVLYPIRAVPQGATVDNDVARTKNEVPFNKWVHIGCEVNHKLISRILIEFWHVYVYIFDEVVGLS